MRSDAPSALSAMEVMNSRPVCIGIVADGRLACVAAKLPHQKPFSPTDELATKLSPHSILTHFSISKNSARVLISNLSSPLKRKGAFKVYFGSGALRV